MLKFYSDFLPLIWFFIFGLVFVVAGMFAPTQNYKEKGIYEQECIDMKGRVHYNHIMRFDGCTIQGK